MNTKKTLVFVPTYNERENVERLYKGIRGLGLPLDILFLDDNSPDGTGRIIDDIVARDRNVFSIHRKGKEGIGSAHQAGIRFAYEHGYEILVTMDCDFTHDPQDIPAFLNNVADHDIVVGSRYMDKHSLDGWTPYRKLLTKLGHFLTEHLLKLKYDATGAFRVYKLTTIPSHAFNLVSSQGYSFFYESLFILNFNRFTIREIAIKLPARTYGHSKMQLSDAFNSFKFLFSIYINVLTNKEKFTLSEPFLHPTGSNATAPNENVREWNHYWNNQKTTSGLLYDAIAAFYRKYIIKRALNHFVRKYFSRGAKVLHAGCGGGQVDTDVRNHVSLTALDFSVNALNFYKRVNTDNCTLLLGDISNIPLPDNSMDGVYNLGVMEHFSPEQIQRILNEFRRILKPGGRLIIFWPPEYGLSVLFFKLLKIIVSPFMGQNVKFHPVEISRIQSKKQALEIFARSDLRIIKYYFGIRDIFTYRIIVAEKQQ